MGNYIVSFGVVLISRLVFTSLLWLTGVFNLLNKGVLTYMVDTCQSRTHWDRSRSCRDTCHGSRGSPVGGGAASSSQNYIREGLFW